MGMLWIPLSEVTRVEKIFASRLAIREERKRLQGLGKSNEASRKAVLRKYKSSPRV
jgi:hypothetical protein